MIIPILATEKEVQIGDLIRFDASKSIQVKGSLGSINSVLIQPGEIADGIQVFNASNKNWFLDYAFNTYAFDINENTSRIDFEVNGVLYSTNVSNGTYSLEDLLADMKYNIEATAPSLTVQFVVDELNRITTTPSLPLKFLPNATSKGLLRHLGFKSDSLIGNPVEYGLRNVWLIVSSGAESASIFQQLKVYTPEGDALFSEDADLVSFETEIMKWLPQGHGSFIYLHRRAQKEILDWIDRQGYRDKDRNKITKRAFVDNSDVRSWSTALALRLFFTEAGNASNDVFKEKAKVYEKMEIAARSRAVLSLDLDGDNKADDLKGPAISSGKLYLR